MTSASCQCDLRTALVGDGCRFCNPAMAKAYAEGEEAGRKAGPLKIPRAGINFAFILSMPGNNAWNGKWSGDGECYARVKTFVTRSYKEQLLKLVGHHSYSFGDGWRASIEVKVVTKEEKKLLLKATRGFSGYDWMIDKLILHGEIRP